MRARRAYLLAAQLLGVPLLAARDHAVEDGDDALLPGLSLRFREELLRLLLARGRGLAAGGAVGEAGVAAGQLLHLLPLRLEALRLGVGDLLDVDGLVGLPVREACADRSPRERSSSRAVDARSA